MTSIVADLLCGSIPMITPTGASSLLKRTSYQQGGHRYFEQNRPLSSLSSRGARRDRKPNESHTGNTVGSR
jgi:hypothetical protein